MENFNIIRIIIFIGILHSGLDILSNALLETLDDHAKLFFSYLSGLTNTRYILKWTRVCQP